MGIQASICRLVLLVICWKLCGRYSVCLELLWIIDHNQNLKLTHIYARGGELQPEGVGFLSHCFISPKILVPWQQHKNNNKKIRKYVTLAFVCVKQVLW